MPAKLERHLRRYQEPVPAACRDLAEPGRPLLGRDRHRHRPAAPSPRRGLLELGRDLLVRPQGRCRPMPDVPVWLASEHLGQCGVRRLTPWHARRLVNRGADQRVAKSQSRPLGLDQPGRNRRHHCLNR